MLDRVGDENGLAVEAGLRDRFVEHTTRWANEWPPSEVFLVARLLAHHHDAGANWTCAGHNLGGVFVKRTPPAFCLCSP
jgi:hypothetical protein